jgi:tetraacyldisaccharide 4'-kinase
VGGATLGGAGKTPTVLALARALAERGHRVAIASHGYRARRRDARLASGHVISEGDEAAWLARELAADAIPVALGPSWTARLAFAAQHAELVLADGLLQTRPARSALALLVVDGELPFGSNHCPPAGDRRASVERLLAACDAIVALLPAGSEPSRLHRTLSDTTRPVYVAESRLLGARFLSEDGGANSSSLVAPGKLSRLRVGLAVAVARPERILTTLAAHGITPQVVHAIGDHGNFSRPLFPESIDAWLTTAKCSAKLAGRVTQPIGILEQRIELSEALVSRVAALPMPG